MSNARTEPTVSYVPLPSTQRGYGLSFEASSRSGEMVYCARSLVIVRSVANPDEAIVFRGHGVANATCASISPNGEWVASGDDTGRVLVWGKKNHIIKSDVRAVQSVRSVAWDGEGKRIAAVGDGQSNARVFPWDSGSSLGDIKFHPKPVLSVAFKPQRPFRLVTVSEDNAVAFFQGPPFKFVASQRVHTRWPNCVRYMPDGAHFVTVGSDSQVCVFEGKTGEADGTIPAGGAKDEASHRLSVLSLAVSDDGSRLLTASSDGTVKLWDFAGRSLIKTFTLGEGVENQQVAVAFCGDTMLSVSLSGSINYLNPDDESAPARTIHGHIGGAKTMAAVPADGVVFTGGNDGKVTRWSEGGKVAEWTTGGSDKQGFVSFVVASRSGSRVATASLDDRVRWVEAKSNAYDAAGAEVELGGQATALAAHPDDDDVVVATTSNKRVVVVRHGSAQPESVTEVPFKPTAVAVRPGGAEIAVGGHDGTVRVYPVGGNQEIASDKNDGAVTCLSYSADGKYLVAGCAGRAAVVRDATDGYAARNAGHKWKFHKSAVAAARFSPAGDKVITTSADAAIFTFADTEKFSYRYANILTPAAVSDVQFWGDAGTSAAALHSDGVVGFYDSV